MDEGEGEIDGWREKFAVRKSGRRAGRHRERGDLGRVGEARLTLVARSAWHRDTMSTIAARRARATRAMQVTLQDHVKRLRNEREAQAIAAAPAMPPTDFTLKGSVSISLPSGASATSKPRAPAASAATGGGLSALLPPPPGGIAPPGGARGRSRPAVGAPAALAAPTAPDPFAASAACGTDPFAASTAPSASATAASPLFSLPGGEPASCAAPPAAPPSTGFGADFGSSFGDGAFGSGTAFDGGAPFGDGEFGSGAFGGGAFGSSSEASSGGTGNGAGEWVAFGS